MPNQSINARRTFLQGTLGLTCVAASASLAPLFGDTSKLSSGTGKPAGKSTDSASDEILTRVKSVLEVRGEVRLKSNLEAGEKIRRADMESKTTLQYEERFRHSDDASIAALHFQSFEAKNTVEKHAKDSTLRDNSKLMIRWVAPNETNSQTSGIDQPLTESECNLVTSPVVTMFLDRLVPKSGQATGQPSQMDQQSVASLLNLDSIQAGTLAVTLVDQNETEQQLEIKGDLSATAKSVPTKISFNGKATVARGPGIITYLAATITEEREVGFAEPGFNITARIRLIREKLDQSNMLKPLADYAAVLSERQSRLLQLFESADGGYQFFADAEWFIYKDSEIDSVLRLVRNNRSIAQCNLVNLADMEPGKQLTMEGFKADVRRTQGNSNARILEESERLTDTKLRLLRVVASGQVEGIDVMWINMLISNDEGRHVSVVFMSNLDKMAALEGTDIQLADTFEFTRRLKSKEESQAETSTAAKPDETSKK